MSHIHAKDFRMVISFTSPGGSGKMCRLRMSGLAANIKHAYQT